MIHEFDTFEDPIEPISPDKAELSLAETKHKLANLMSHVEFLESRLANQERPLPSSEIVVHYRPESTPKLPAQKTNPTQQ